MAGITEGDAHLLQLGGPNPPSSFSSSPKSPKKLIDSMKNNTKNFDLPEIFICISVSRPGPDERAAHWVILGLQVGMSVVSQCVASTIPSSAHDFSSMKNYIRKGENFLIKTSQE